MEVGCNLFCAQHDGEVMSCRHSNCQSFCSLLLSLKAHKSLSLEPGVVDENETGNGNGNVNQVKRDMYQASVNVTV